jgi:hypothetical protein
VTSCFGFTVFAPDEETAESVRELVVKEIRARQEDLRELRTEVLIDTVADFGERWEEKRLEEGDLFPKEPT